MHLARFLLVLTLTWSASTRAEYFKAAVVEYSPAINPSMEPEENILNNVNNYVTFISNASSQQADIIVFPEIGLKGYGNLPFYSVVPHPNEAVSPCTFNTTYSKALVRLSCAARVYKIYVVVNLPETYYNASRNATLHYNTNVVFDRNGTVVARYRKYNLFGEFSTNVPDLEYVHFDTDFGVRFGIFICFDMEFRDPPLTLAQDFGVRHFVFSTAWFSELPFLTAIQAQWSFSYSLDVVLLASGYNNPTSGSTGSGIYQGRDGPYEYMQTEYYVSRMLIASVLKKNESLNVSANVALSTDICFNGEGCTSLEVTALETDLQSLSYKMVEADSQNLPTDDDVFGKSRITGAVNGTTKLRMLQDAVRLYNSELLFSPETCEVATCVQDNSSSVSLMYTTYTELCHHNFCCVFNISMTTLYEEVAPNSTNRGDDYNQLYYRLAVFNGVRSYSGFATGGIQLCSIIPCVDDTLGSCGLRSDHSLAKPRTINDKTYGELYQTTTTFDHIEIHSTFDYNSIANTFIYPDMLVRGTGDNFGSLLSLEDFGYRTVEPFNGTVHCELVTTKSIENLITFGMYGRQFGRDGQPESTIDSLSSTIKPSLILFIISFLILIMKYN